MPDKYRAYKSLWNKVQVRDKKILRLKADIESLKAYASKRSNYYRNKKASLRKCIAEKQKLKSQDLDIKKFIRDSFDRKTFELMDMLLRLRSVLVEVRSEVTQGELTILAYLANVDFSTMHRLRTELNLSAPYVLEMVKSLQEKQMIRNNKSYGTNNYIYITEEGKKVISTFIELMKKTKLFQKQQ